MVYARVAVYRFRPGMAVPAIGRAQAGMLPIFREQPGFVAYEVVKTGDDAAVSISTWGSAEHARRAVEMAAGWVKDNIGDMVVSVENHVGEVSFSSRG